VVAHDPHVPTPTVPFEEAVQDADVVVVATNHYEFCDPGALATIAQLASPDCLVVDPWNCWGAGQVFAYANELATLGAPST
jgi:UDP-N-acetyl-D-mannosaminuronic acid dehydrogenase